MSVRDSYGKTSIFQTIRNPCEVLGADTPDYPVMSARERQRRFEERVRACAHHAVEHRHFCGDFSGFPEERYC